MNIASATGLRATLPLILSLSIFALGGCASYTKVERIDPEETVDLSGDWNDTDSRLVAQEMITDVLARPWLGSFKTSKGKNPNLIVGTVKNRTSEHIATTAFIKDLERELINSGRVTFVANKSEREEVREERADQQENASIETMKQFQRETGADYLLRGDITSIVDQEGGESVKFYQVNLELIDMETNTKAWIGDKKIKKLVSKSDVGY